MTTGPLARTYFPFTFKFSFAWDSVWNDLGKVNRFQNKHHPPSQGRILAPPPDVVQREEAEQHCGAAATAERDVVLESGRAAVPGRDGPARGAETEGNRLLGTPSPALGLHAPRPRELALGGGPVEVQELVHQDWHLCF